MKQSMHYGNTHVFSATQQSQNTKRALIQKHPNSIKNWLHSMSAFVKESLEKNGDFFLNDNDF
jgi:glutamate synthase domain-containing protein 2